MFHENLVGVAALWVGLWISASFIIPIVKLENFKEVLFFTLAWSDFFLLLFFVTLKSVDDTIKDFIELKQQLNPLFFFLINS